jgi:gliding motility-associated-like protein
VTLGETTKEGFTTSPDSLEVVVTQTRLFALQQVTDDSGCVADPLTLTGSASAFAYPVPVAHAGADQQVCGNTGTLQAVKSIPGSSGWWSAPEAQLSDETDPSSQAVATRYGTLKFAWKEQNWQCADTDTVAVTFYETPQAPEAGADQELDFTFATQLQATTPAAGSGLWTVVEGNALFSNDTLPDAMVTDLSQDNTLRWTVRNGVCPEVHDDVNITVKALSIPKGFTPNGDNNHDFFDLGALHAREIELHIYNSSGVLIYESDDYLNDDAWEGRNLNGVELPEGTYYYVAKIKVDGLDKVFTFKSFVEILR